MLDGVEVVELSFGCRVTGAEMCLLLRLPDGRLIHSPGVVDPAVRLHDADCPMTNERKRDRTVCICDTDSIGGGPRELDTPEGTGD